MVNIERRKINNNRVLNPKGHKSCIQKECREAMQIPLCVFKEMLNNDFNLRLKFNRLDTSGNRSPLEIPVWLLRNLLRQDSEHANDSEPSCINIGSSSKECATMD